VNGLTLRGLLRASIASTVLAALTVAGLSVPAAAAETTTLTVSVTNVSGAPLAGISVFAIAIADGAEIPGNRLANGQYPKATAVKGKPGVYTFSSLGLTDHTLYFGTATKTTFAQLLGGASDLERAQIVPAGQPTLSVSLASNSVISGVVKSAAGKALKKAYVTAHYFTGSGWLAYSTTRTDAKGKYSLTDLDPGSYKLEFSGASTEYSRLFSGGASSFDSATALAVGVGKTTTVNAVFPKAVGTLSGTASVEYEGFEEYGTFPLEDARVVAYPVLVDPSGSNNYTPTIDFDRGVASAATKKNGRWSVKNLVAGRYVVKLYPNYYNQDGGYSGGSTLRNAYIYTVTAGKTTKVSWSLESKQTKQGGSLSVELLSHLGDPIAGAGVMLQNLADPDYYFYATSNAAGKVVFGKSGKNRTIQPGKFTLSVNSNGEWEPYKAEVEITSTAQTKVVFISPLFAPAGFTVAPTIAQTELAVGTKFVVAAQSKRSTAKLRYQWLRNSVPIYGADEATYVSRVGDIGSSLSVRVTTVEVGFPNRSATVTVTGAITSSASVPTNTRAPSITPSANAWVGTTLHIVPGTWSVPGLTFNYAWFRDGVPFAHEGESYDVTLADVGAEFTAVVTASKTGYVDATASTPTGVTPALAGATLSRTAPVVTSSVKGLKKGTTKYTVSPGTWTSRNTNFTYSWKRGGVEVGTGATFLEKPTKADLAKTLEVVVSATAEGFEPGAASTIARKASAPLQLATAPTVTRDADGSLAGAAAPIANGSTITASTGSWIHGTDDAGALTYSYKWLRKVGKAKPVAIAGATQAKYTLIATDLGAAISVTITARSTRWGDASTTVAAGTGTGRPGLVSTALDPVISGSTLVGDDLRLSSLGSSPAVSVKYALQWYGCAKPLCTDDTPLESFTKIAKATAYQYAPTANLTNGRVYVVVTTSAVGWTTSVRRSNVVRVVAGNGLPVLSKLTIPAATVEVEADVWSPEVQYGARIDGEVVRDWQVCFSDCLSESATWTTAAGTVSYSKRFKPAVSNWGTGESYLRVKETAMRGTVSAVSVSNAVPFVQGKLSTRVSAPYRLVTSANVNTLTPNNAPTWITTTATWYVDGEARSTDFSYTRTAEDAGKRLWVTTKVTAPGLDDYEYLQIATGSAAITPPVASATSIVGTKFGEKLSLSDPEPFKDLPGADYARWNYSYYWDNAAYGLLYTPNSSRVGKIMSVRITVTSSFYGTFSTTVTADSALLPGDPLAVTRESELQWAGDLLPGTTVTAALPEFSALGASTAIVWQTSADNGVTWVTEPRGNVATFTPGLIHADRMLRVQVTGTKAGHGSAVSTSEPVRILEGNPVRVLGVPVLSGEARVGATLTTTFGVWSEGSTIRVEWLLNGRAIPGATGATTYVPLAINAGDEISVRVTGSQTGKLDVVAESSAKTIADGFAPVASKLPVIAGTTKLTATQGVWTVSGLTFTFIWSRGGEMVGIGNEFVVPAGSVRGDYTLTVRATRFGYGLGAVDVRG